MKARPSDIVGSTVIGLLRAAGFRIVPADPTKALQRAAMDAMRKRRDRMGDSHFWVSNRVKTGIRWKAMMDVWTGDSA